MKFFKDFSDEDWDGLISAIIVFGFSYLLIWEIFPIITGR